MEGLKRLLQRDVLDFEAAHALMGAIMRGETTQAQVGAFLTVYRMRDPVVEELAGFVTAMRDACVKLPTRRTGLLDTCGTGGAIVKTFNTSTLAGLVAAACGASVAKHGNRSVTSPCGSADVLEALGVDLHAPVLSVGRALDEVGFAFLFAPMFHPAMRHASGPRKELGGASVFNLLGPMSNPARPAAQLLGVGRPDLLELIPATLARIGTDAVVVHGTPGMDEVSLSGPTAVVRVRGGKLDRETVDPSGLGFEHVDPAALCGLPPPRAAQEAKRVLAGDDGPRSEHTIINAAGGLLAGGLVKSWPEGVDRARRAVENGHAQEVLERYLAIVGKTGA